MLLDYKKVRFRKKHDTDDKRRLSLLDLYKAYDSEARLFLGFHKTDRDETQRIFLFGH